MSKSMTDITLDIETLSVRPNAQVLSISAVGFNPFEITTDFTDNPKLDILVSLDGQEHRDVQDDTVWWWSMRSPEVQAKIFNEVGRLAVPEALDQLIKFCWQKNRIWCQGPTLDITVLTHLFEEHGKGVPWGYGAVRDSRTLLDLVYIEAPEATHDSLEDCIRQTKMVQEALSKLGITKFVRNK
jgi:hypothetical protein